MSKQIIPAAIKEKKAAAESLDLSKFFKKKVTLEELSMMCRQMYSLSRAGVVMTRAFRGLAESVANPRLSEVLLEVEASLNSGVNLGASLRRHQDVFDPLFINIVAAGENSGRLDLAFKQLSSYLYVRYPYIFDIRTIGSFGCFPYLV